MATDSSRDPLRSETAPLLKAQCSEKTLAKLAYVGGGPAYHRFGRIPRYTVADLDEFAQAKISKPVRSTSEYGVD
jgi:hypothetical protein